MIPDSQAASQNNVEQFLSGKLTQVDVAAIERELKELWQSAEVGAAEGQRPSVARACVLNLVLYSTDLDAEVTAGNLLDDIAVQHPCRALLAIYRLSEALRLEAWVSTRCHLPTPTSTKQICCEQITVRWEGDGVHELPSVVIPLLVPDLPVFLFWRVQDFDTAALTPFLKAIDRLIIDSSRWAVPFRSFPLVTYYLKQMPGKPIISDLNWLRTLEWRRILSGAFDDPSTGLQPDDFAGIESVSMQFNPPSSSQAFLLLSWLASRLGWKPLSRKILGINKAEFAFQGKDKNVSAQWMELSSDVVPSGLVVNADIVMTGGKQLTVDLQAKEGTLCLVAKSLQAEKMIKQSIIPILDHSESRLVSRELEALDRDLVYEEAMMMAHKIGLLS